MERISAVRQMERSVVCDDDVTREQTKEVFVSGDDERRSERMFALART